MEESFREVGRDIGQALLPLYAIGATSFAILAIANRERKQKSQIFWFAAVGWTLSLLMNLPSPWGMLPAITLMIIGTSVAYRLDVNAKRKHLILNALFSVVAILAISVSLWWSPGWTVVLTDSKVTQYFSRGELWGTFPKETQFKIRAFRSSSNTYLLWSVSDNKDFSKRPLSLTTKDIYWNRKYGFINGDQLALRIAEWAETPVEVGDWVNKVPEKTAP